MPQTDGLVTTPPTSSHTSTESSSIEHTFFKFEQEEEQQQHFTNSNTTNITNDPYATYTDNFDLSLLPQDCTATATAKSSTTTLSSQIPAIAVTNSSSASSTNLIENIPTTVFNFDKRPLGDCENPQLLGVPDIKIEQTWSSCPSLNSIKQEQAYQSYFPVNNQHNQLIPPPPAYPAHIYPSPQSSPAQSEYGFPQTQFSGCYESLGSSRNSLYGAVSSPCPSSLDVQSIKQEQLHILPPSPPESNCDTPTPQSACSNTSSNGGFDFKSEPFDSDVETFHDLKYSPPRARDTVPSHNCRNQAASADSCNIPSRHLNNLNPHDHLVLREYLEDTTFQKRHNLKPLALDSIIGGLEEVPDNIDPVISLALEHAKREADATCAKLQISQGEF